MNYYSFRVRLATNVTEIRRGTLVRRSIDEKPHAHTLLSSPIAHHFYASVYMNIQYTYIRSCRR